MDVCDQLIIHWPGTTDRQVGSSHANIMPWRPWWRSHNAMNEFATLNDIFSQNFCIQPGVAETIAFNTVADV